MKIIATIVLFLWFFPAIAFTPISVRSEAALGGHDELIKALIAALKELRRVDISSEKKTIVISRSRGYIVVSLIAPRDMYGGSAYLVYDSKLDKIVHVSATQ